MAFFMEINLLLAIVRWKSLAKEHCACGGSLLTARGKASVFCCFIPSRQQMLSTYEVGWADIYEYLNEVVTGYQPC